MNKEQIRQEFERALGEYLSTLGFDVENPELEKTPKRFAKYLTEIAEGYPAFEATTFDTQFSPHKGTVIQEGIKFNAACEHHLLPFWGTATVKISMLYNSRQLGLSKIARIVKQQAKQFTCQEAVTKNVAETIKELIEQGTVEVETTCVHSCMCGRGVESTAVTKCVITI